LKIIFKSQMVGRCAPSLTPIPSPIHRGIVVAVGGTMVGYEGGKRTLSRPPL